MTKDFSSTAQPEKGKAFIVFAHKAMLIYVYKKMGTEPRIILMLPDSTEKREV